MNQRQIPPELWNRVLDTLRTCAPFTDARQLGDICADPRLKPWQHQLPTNSQNFRELLVTVRTLLADKTSLNGDNALVLLLQILSELVDPGDKCHEQLSDLAVDLEEALKEPAENKPDLKPSSLKPSSPLPLYINIQVGVLKITLRLDGENWQLLVTNTGSIKLRHVTLVLRPSPAIAVHPAQFKLGTIPPAATMIADRLSIRPNPDNSDEFELPFKIDYLVENKKERQEAMLHIPI